MAPLVTLELTLIWMGSGACWPAAAVSGCSEGVGWISVGLIPAVFDADKPSVVKMKLADEAPEVAVTVL